MSSSQLRCRLSIDDRISALPDLPLDRILSFLPIKEAAATMILSKRWKQLWLGGQLILNFKDQASTLILSCKTLVVLNLNNLVFEEDIPPYVVDLPSLKLLHLESITFTFYSYLIKILSSCPILQELETKDLTVKNNYRVHPDIPNTHVTLSKLIRANISGMHIMYDFLNNVEHLQLQVVCIYQ
jgi:hypothetical protein